MLNMTEWFTEWYWTYDFFKLFQVFKTFHLFISFPPLTSAALHLLRSLHLLRLNLTSLDWEARGCAGRPSIFAACCWSSCSGVVTRGNDCPIWLPKTINFCIVLSFYFRFFPQNLGDLSYFHLPSIQKDQLYEKVYSVLLGGNRPATAGEYCKQPSYYRSCGQGTHSPAGFDHISLLQDS